MKVVIKYECGWQSVAAFACFAISPLSLAIGVIFTTGFILNADRHPLLHGVGLTLLIIGIPILILGGHFLDLIETRQQTHPLPRGGTDLIARADQLHYQACHATRIRSQY